MSEEDREYIKDDNFYCTGQKNPTDKFRDNWDLIEWDEEDERPSG
jgi:hypothetical protein